MAQQRNRSWYERLLRIEPGISLGQWLYDRITNNWDRLAAVFVGGGGMAYLAAITDWLRAWGPVAVGAVGLLSALIIWLGIPLATSWRAGARIRKLEADAHEKALRDRDAINPLSPEFHTKRINLLDVKHPLVNKIQRKRFIDCELLGPLNIVNGPGTHLSNAQLLNCDVVVIRPHVTMYNAVLLENCQIIGGSVMNCTFYINVQDIAAFRAMGSEPISFTGDSVA